MIESLVNIFSKDGVLTDRSDLAIWGTDWTRSYKVAPSAVVFPKKTEEVVALVRLANESGFCLVPSGGRTGLSGGAVASDGEVVVSFEKMNRILDFNRTDQIVRCESGVVTQALQEYADDRGMYYPVDFASSGSSHIGGNIATNAGGIKVIRYGLTRDWVLGLKVVTGTGDVINCNRGLIKNATGYDLRHLFIGSEGTLGFIVEAEIRLAPKPVPQRVMVLGVNELHSLLSILETFQAELTLSAFEFFSDLALTKVLNHRSLQKPLSSENSFYALIEYDAKDDPIAFEAFQKTIDLGWVSDGVVSQSDAQAAALWSLREGITESIAPHTPYKNDVSVRISEVPGFLSDVDQVVNRRYPEFDVCWFGHIGDGNLHLNILRPDNISTEEFYRRCHDISPELFDLIQHRGGSISAEHGVGLLKRDFLSFSRSPAEIEIMRKLKSVFDPNNIMNPGKILR